MVDSKAQSQLKCQEADVDFWPSLLLESPPPTLPPYGNNNIQFFNQARHTHTFIHQQHQEQTHSHTHTEMGTNLFSSQLARKGLIVCQSAKVAHTHTHTRLPKYPSIYRFCITCTCAPSFAGAPNEPSANDQSPGHLPFLFCTSCASATFTLYFNAFRLRSYMFTCLFWLPSVLAAGWP